VSRLHSLASKPPLLGRASGRSHAMTTRELRPPRNSRVTADETRSPSRGRVGSRSKCCTSKSCTTRAWSDIGNGCLRSHRPSRFTVQLPAADERETIADENAVYENGTAANSRHVTYSTRVLTPNTGGSELRSRSTSDHEACRSRRMRRGRRLTSPSVGYAASPRDAPPLLVTRLHRHGRRCSLPRSGAERH
jgi:hypothetical protein